MLRFDDVFDDYDFFETVVDVTEGEFFLSFLFGIVHFKGRLDVIFSASFCGNKINFVMIAAAFSFAVDNTLVNNSHIHIKATVS